MSRSEWRNRRRSLASTAPSPADQCGFRYTRGLWRTLRHRMTRPRASREGDDASSQRMSEMASESSSSPRALRGRERADDGCRGTRRELVRRTSDAACIRVLRRMRLSREFAYQMRRSTDDSNSTHGGSLVAGVGVRLGWMPAGRGTTYDLRIEVITLYNNMHWS